MTKTRPHIWWRRSILSLVAAIVVFSHPVFSFAQEKLVPEYHLKAVFLYNLVNFVTWPEERYEEERPFEIGILGIDPFGPVLEQTVAGEMWHGKPIRLEYLENISDLENHRCDILFVTSSAIDQWPDISRMLGDAPVLTVADHRSFTAAGGMVSLVQEGRRIAIEINRRAASSAGLFISSKLLRLARVVD